jgi:hypothetical protein
METISSVNVNPSIFWVSAWHANLSIEPIVCRETDRAALLASFQVTVTGIVSCCHVIVVVCKIYTPMLTVAALPGSLSWSR